MEVEASVDRQNLTPLGDTRFDEGGERPVLSRMEHSVRDRNVAGSNPVAPTKISRAGKTAVC